MSVKILSVAKQLPKHTRETKDIIPFVKLWMLGQETRFQRKVLKLFDCYQLLKSRNLLLDSVRDDWYL